MKSASVRALSLPWMDVDFIITILPVYFGSNAEYSPYVYSAHGQSCGPEEATTATLELLRALRRIPLHDPSSSPKLSGPSSSSSSAEERRVYACWMLLRLWAENFWLIECHHWHIFSPSATLIVKTKSLLSGWSFKFSVAFLLANLKTLPKCDPYLNWQPAIDQSLSKNAVVTSGAHYIQSFIFRHGKIVQYLNLLFLQQILDLRK